MNRLISRPVSKFRYFRQREEDDKQHPYEILWRCRVLNPGTDIVNYWYRVFLFTSMIALFVDPMYFYLPHMSSEGCMGIDARLKHWVTFFRTLTDVFQWLHIAMKFRIAFVAPSSKIFGRGELVRDPKEIARRYMRTDFIVDLAASLPLPQIVIWIVIPSTDHPKSEHTNNALALLVLVQYIPRLFVIYPLNHQIVKATGIVAKTAWTGAAFNLASYLIASHVVGAAWYLSSIARQLACWNLECNKEKNSAIPCLRVYLSCDHTHTLDRKRWFNVTSTISNCDAKRKGIDFKFGMFAAAFENDVTSATFMKKYSYCLWWGLRSLSSYGQDLDTTTYIGENLFCVFLAITGLGLFALLIGNVQNYLQSMSQRVEEFRVMKKDTEEWMRHRQLPPELQERVRKFVAYQWLATRGVDEEAILKSLPLDLRRQIRRHLCLSLVRRVPFFSQMDGQLLDAICQRLVSSLSTEGTYVVREGDPVTEMVFVIRGQLESSTTNGGRSGFFNCIRLRPGDFCGEELLTWALMPSSSTLHLPSSTRTVRALNEVEAFALHSEDLKFVASRFKRLHSKKLQHAFRYYSHQWRTWAACYIQVKWRRLLRRRELKELMQKESSYYMDNPSDKLPYDEYDDHENTKSSQNLSSSLLASKFAANAKRGTNRKIKASEPVHQLFKPEEPDFYANEDDHLLG